MKVSILVGVGYLLQCVNALAIAPRQQTVPGVISAPMWRRDETRSVQNDLARRERLLKRQSVPVTLANSADKLLYFANSTSYPWEQADIVTIGTPGQKVALQIDTGSSDIWVEVPESRLCQQSSNPCSTSGTYENSTSSSYRYVNSLFSIQYADGTYAKDKYTTETFQIGSSSIFDEEC